jgi:hypothetical protein
MRHRRDGGQGGNKHTSWHDFIYVQRYGGIIIEMPEHLNVYLERFH